MSWALATQASKFTCFNYMRLSPEIHTLRHLMGGTVKMTQWINWMEGLVYIFSSGPCFPKNNYHMQPLRRSISGFLNYPPPDQFFAQACCIIIVWKRLTRWWDNAEESQFQLTHHWPATRTRYSATSRPPTAPTPSTEWQDVKRTELVVSFSYISYRSE